MDIVRDDDGFLVVFSEQGTSASHVSAAKLLDAISRGQDMDGADADEVFGAGTSSTKTIDSLLRETGTGVVVAS